MSFKPFLSFARQKANHVNFKDSLPEVFHTIGETADALGIKTYAVGGYVRDLFLQRASKDIDIVTLGSGIALAEAFAHKLAEKPKVNVFKNFGTAQVLSQDWEVEFVGARKESYRADSRKPIVEDGSLEEDQKRRDFTINALSIGLNKENFGEIMDPFNGLEDLEARLIRTPLEPAITFSDDPLRMLRAIRFASQLNFDIEPETLEGLRNTAERISIISQERITEEINKIILSTTPSFGFKLLDHCGLLEKIFPELVALKGAETRDGIGHKDNFYHTLQVLDNISKHTGNLWVRWAAILHDIAKPATKRFHPKSGWTFHNHEEIGARWVKGIFKRFRLPLDHKMRSVRNLVRLHLRPIALAKEGVTDSALRRLLVDAGEDLEDLLMLCRADITSKDPNRVRRYLKNFDRVEQLLKELEEKDQLRNFQPVITGEIIMEAFQIGPSKEVGEIKSMVREAILDGSISNQMEPAFKFMKECAEKMGFVVVKDLNQLQKDSTP